jgi:flagellar basal-body rod protein FlgB
MDLSKQNLFKMIGVKLSYLAERQKVIAQNISNSDTPGYRPRDLKKLDFKDEVHRAMFKVTPVETQAAHMRPVTPAEPFKVEQSMRPYETGLDKNGSVLEEQSQKQSEIAGDYQAATTIYKKYLAMYKLVLK